MSGELDLQRYTDWFVWARANLGRELDPTHAAAEAAYRAAEGGAADADAQAAAQSAGAEPASVDPETMALAEWAAWAQSTGRFRPDQCLTVARHALASVRSSHDLDAAIKEVLAAAPPPQRQSTSNRTGLLIAGVVVGLLIIGGATAGVIGSISQQQGNSPPAGKPFAQPTLTATLLSNGEAFVAGRDFPPNATVYVFVERQVVTSTKTTSSGSLGVTVPVPFGGHTVSACFDAQELDCPASIFISRDQ